MDWRRLVIGDFKPVHRRWSASGSAGSYHAHPSLEGAACFYPQSYHRHRRDRVGQRLQARTRCIIFEQILCASFFHLQVTLVRGDKGAWRCPGFAREGAFPHNPLHQFPAPEPDLPTPAGESRSPFRDSRRGTRGFAASNMCIGLHNLFI